MSARVKLLFKIGISLLAFYLVFRKITWSQLSAALASMEAVWLIPAFLLYNLSQWISAARLLQQYRAIKIPLSFVSTVRLYYKAMFYGLFLPGGVSGDVYKVVTLQKIFQRPYRELITATLMDRVNGLLMLITIALLLVMINASALNSLQLHLQLVVPLALLAGWMICLFVMRRYFSVYATILVKTSILSFLIQSFQLMAFFTILKGLNLPSSQWMQYGILFYAGSILSALPISIGGIGIREWVLVSGAGIFLLDAPYAFTASFLMTLIVSLSALCGAFIKQSGYIHE
jgi:uncharacterized membrane protein YbhN (UPF0104 family)